MSEGRSFLAHMAHQSAERARALLDTRVLSELRSDLERLPERVARRPHPDRFLLIGEIKPRSPSAGALLTAEGPSLLQRARILVEAGVSALSVLTEPARFGGDLDLLREVRATTTLPILRKDFLVHPAQIYESRLAGADLVLIVADMLDDAALNALLDACEHAGLLPLVEAFDIAELLRAEAALGGRAGLLGLNCRDLRTLAVDPRRFATLASRLPSGRRVIAESGLTSAGGIRRARQLGYSGALVGTALMTSPDPAHLARAMSQAARGPLGPTRRAA